MIPTPQPLKKIRARQTIGKYRIEKRIATGPFAAVYQGYDTIQGTRYALKVPHAQFMDEQFLADFRMEVRLHVRLDHKHILPVKDASFIDGYFVIVTPLGKRTLADRIKNRMTVPTVMDLTEQMLLGVAHAHGARIIHCDVKPENFILFDDNWLRLADFGIAKVALKTLKASGSGTIGYVAPEQAMGRPSYYSDVFSLGLIIYRMLTGHLPEWPFDWPPPRCERLSNRVPAEFASFLRKAMHVRPNRRFADAQQMLDAFRRIGGAAASRNREPGAAAPVHTPERPSAKAQQSEFKERFGKVLGIHAKCRKCCGPVAQTMQCCPWCGTDSPVPLANGTFPAHCPRCKRGAKLDWRYCAWCYGYGFEVETSRRYSDKRYTARCQNTACSDGRLMPFMRYCPWCRTKVKRKWRIRGSAHTCNRCDWGVAKDYWSFCAWCSQALEADERR